MLPPLEARTSARCATFRRGGRQSTLQQLEQPSAIRTPCAAGSSRHKWIERETARVRLPAVSDQKYWQLSPIAFSNQRPVPPLSATEPHPQPFAPRSRIPRSRSVSTT